MSIIDRIKHLKPKQWAMIVGGAGVVGLGYDYYRRRGDSLVGRALERIHPSAPESPEPPPMQQQPSAPSMPGGAPYDMGMAQLPMGGGGEMFVEEPYMVTPYAYAPGYSYYPWYGRAWGYPHGYGPHHEFHGGHPGGHPGGPPHAQPHPHQHHPQGQQQQQHGAPPPQAPQQQQQHGAPPPPSGHHH